MGKVSAKERNVDCCLCHSTLIWSAGLKHRASDASSENISGIRKMTTLPHATTSMKESIKTNSEKFFQVRMPTNKNNVGNIKVVDQLHFQLPFVK